MPQVIGCDAHKQFSVFVEIDSKGKTSAPVRVEHNRQAYIDFLHRLPPNSEIALEATGHWYWMVDAMEQAGHRPHLANPTEAKKRMGKPTRPTLSMPRDSPSCSITALCPRAGFLRANCVTDESCSVRVWLCAISAPP